MLFRLRKSVKRWVYKMLENAIAVVVSLIVALVLVYIVDKKWG
jgi:hypothetical protein